MQRWTQYCQDLYIDRGGGDEVIKELESIIPPIHENAENIQYSEVEEAIRALKKHKSSGADGITAEMIQAG
ncbi:unnamed protein product, partial [Rotaria sp. Silwood1]